MAGYRLGIGDNTKLVMGIGMQSSDSMCSEFESHGDEHCPDQDCELGFTLVSLDMDVYNSSVGSEDRAELGVCTSQIATKGWGLTSMPRYNYSNVLPSSLCIHMKSYIQVPIIVFYTKASLDGQYDSPNTFSSVSSMRRGQMGY